MPLSPDILSRWHSRQLRRPSDLDRALWEFNPLFAYHTERLEGREADLETAREYFQTGTVSQFTGDPQMLIRLYDQKRCYEYLRERVLARDEMDTALVLELHRILNSGAYNDPALLRRGERAGEFKKQDLVAPAGGAGSPAREVGRELDQLMEEVSGYCGERLLRDRAALRRGLPALPVREHPPLCRGQRGHGPGAVELLPAVPGPPAPGVLFPGQRAIPPVPDPL